MKPKSNLARALVVVTIAVAGFVVWQAALTLGRLETVERERDTWQRPAAVIEALGIGPGDTVVDFGSGSGYFSVRLAPVVGPSGAVVAVDIRQQPLAFLWLRTMLHRQWQVRTVRTDETTTLTLDTPADAALIVNTYHELSSPQVVMHVLHAALAPGARLVVVDRRPRSGPAANPQVERERHTLSPATAEAEILAAGFTLLHRDDTFIDRPADEPWWLMAFVRP